MVSFKPQGPVMILPVFLQPFLQLHSTSNLWKFCEPDWVLIRNLFSSFNQFGGFFPPEKSVPGSSSQKEPVIHTAVSPSLRYLCVMTLKMPQYGSRNEGRCLELVLLLKLYLKRTRHEFILACIVLGLLTSA